MLISTVSGRFLTRSQVFFLNVFLLLMNLRNYDVNRLLLSVPALAFRGHGLSLLGGCSQRFAFGRKSRSS